MYLHSVHEAGRDTAAAPQEGKVEEEAGEGLGHGDEIVGSSPTFGHAE
jgi:hypothetical protein